MKSREDINKELEQIAPSLIKPKELGNSEVPEGYFEQFPKELFSALELSSEAKRRSIWSLSNVYKMGIAASFVLVAGYFLGTNKADTTFELNPNFDDQEAMAFLIDNIDHDEIYNLVDNEIVEDIELSLMDLEFEASDAFLESAIENMEDSAIEEYF